MPPAHSRSTGADRMAWISSGGDSSSASLRRTFLTSSVRVIERVSRVTIMPPADSTERS